MSVQLEDGYTRFANELLEAMLTARLSSRQWAVLIALARKTYGFNKKEDDIGLSQLAELTGLAKSHVSVTVRELEERRIINRRQGKFGHVMGINKAHKTWVGIAKSATGVTESVTVTETVTGGYRIGTVGVTELVQGGVTESVTTKDNPTKDNQKTIPKECAPQAERDDVVADRRSGQDRRIADRFEDFYAAYPRKKSRQQAMKAFAKLDPDEQLLTEIISGIGRAMKSEEWRDKRFIPHPATWLNAQGWLDEIEVDYSASELVVIRSFNATLGDQLGQVDEQIYVAKRAGAIADFLGLSAKPAFHEMYFEWVRDNCDLPPHVGFDWLIGRDAFTKIKGGQFERKQTA